MEVYIFDNHQQLGPFTEEAVADMSRMGSVSAEARVWHEGVADWYPISELVARIPPGANEAVAPGPGPLVAGTSMAALRVPQVRDDDMPSHGACVARGLAAGFLVAVIGGGLWSYVFLVQNFRIPFLSLIIGWGAGTASSWASRNEASILLPINAALWTFLACFAPSLGIYSMVALIMACGLAWRQAAD